MSRYKAEKFNFSGMSERISLLTPDDGVYSKKLGCWAHVLKDGFTRIEDEHFYKVMVREQKALLPLLEKTTRVKWKNKLFQLSSWQDPSVEDRGFMELIIKQIPGDEIGPDGNGIGDSEIFKDFVSIYRVTKHEKISYGITTYSYTYDFNKPIYQNVRCMFSTDRNRFLDDKKIQVEHDSLIVRFSKNTDIKEEDYIISPDHGTFKVDMVAPIDGNVLEVYVQRREAQ